MGERIFVGLYVFIFVVNMNISVDSKVLIKDFFPFEEAKGSINHIFSSSDYKFPVTLEREFKFLNKTYTRVNLCIHGWMRFGNTIGNVYQCDTPATAANIMPLIALTDYYDRPAPTSLTHFQSTNKTFLQTATDKITSELSLSETFSFEYIFVATWMNVKGYHNDSSSRNTYQVVLVTDGENSFLLFYYNRLEWVTAEATIGLDGGYGSKDYRFTFSGSCQSSGIIKNTINESNINKPGIWGFKVDSEILNGYPCVNLNVKNSAELNQTIFPITGNFPLVMKMPCSSLNRVILCQLIDSGGRKSNKTTAIRIQGYIVCPLPYFYSLGRVNLILSEFRHSKPGREVYNGFIYVVPQYEYGHQLVVNVTRTVDDRLLLMAKWDREELILNEMIVFDKLEIVLIEYDGKHWKEIGSLTDQFLNNGYHISHLNKQQLIELTITSEQNLVRTFALKGIYAVPNSTDILQKLIVSDAAKGMDILFSLRNLDSEHDSLFDTACRSWNAYEHVSNHHDIIPCPGKFRLANVDWRFRLDKSGLSSIQVNKNVSNIFIQKLPSVFGESTQCSYDSHGNLLHGINGTTEIQSHSSVIGQNYYDHYLYDVLPYLTCYKWGIHVSLYYQSKRFLKLSTEYKFPKYAKAIGQGHLTTFNGVKYTFLTTGEFQMIRVTQNIYDTYTPKFIMNIGINKVSLGSNYVPVIMVAAMYQTFRKEETKVQAYWSSKKNDIIVMVNNEPLPTNLTQREFSFYFTGVAVSILSRENVVITFTSGFAFKIFGAPVSESINIIALVDQKWNGKINGLWGNCENEADNDLAFPDGSKISAKNLSSLEYAERFARAWKVQSENKIIVKNDDFSFTSSVIESASFNTSFDRLVNRTMYDFCGDDDDCEFDINVTTNGAYAKATRLANSVFLEIPNVGSQLGRTCPRILETRNTRVSANTFKINATLELYCDNGFEIHPGVERIIYSCKAKDNHEPQWENSTGDVLTPENQNTIVCLQRPTSTATTFTTSELESIFLSKSLTPGLNEQTTTVESMLIMDNVSTYKTSDSNAIAMLMIGFSSGAGFVIICIVLDAIIRNLKGRCQQGQNNLAEVNFSLTELM